MSNRIEPGFFSGSRRSNLSVNPDKAPQQAPVLEPVTLPADRYYYYFDSRQNFDELLTLLLKAPGKRILDLYPFFVANADAFINRMSYWISDQAILYLLKIRPSAKNIQGIQKRHTTEARVLTVFPEQDELPTIMNDYKPLNYMLAAIYEDVYKVHSKRIITRRNEIPPEPGSFRFSPLGVTDETFDNCMIFRFNVNYRKAKALGGLIGHDIEDETLCELFTHAILDRIGEGLLPNDNENFVSRRGLFFQSFRPFVRFIRDAGNFAVRIIETGDKDSPQKFKFVKNESFNTQNQMIVEHLFRANANENVYPLVKEAFDKIGWLYNQYLTNSEGLYSYKLRTEYKNLGSNFPPFQVEITRSVSIDYIPQKASKNEN